MRFSLRAKSVANVNDVKTSLIKSRRIIFTPTVELKEELADTAIQITCYDRDDKLVKRVTTDAGEVEDPEDDNQENGGTTGDGGSQNQGGGENTNPTNPGGNGGDDEEEGGQN